MSTEIQPTEMQSPGSVVRPIKIEDNRVLLLDQRQLPDRVVYLDASHLDAMVEAIRDMAVRGAPAIGVAAALGLASYARLSAAKSATRVQFLTDLAAAKEKLQQSRPTAVNLRWGTEAIFNLAQELSGEGPLSDAAEAVFQRAVAMIEEDIAINRQMGQHGSALIPDKANVLTHCNAGALATCGWGTALGVLRSAKERGADLTVYVDETRPRQQGARLTTWELLADHFNVILIADTMAGYLMGEGKIDLVIVGADRIALNGDAANKIGTYGVAVMARAHGIPFYVAAPLSTVDFTIATGKQIPIEQRHADEVKTVNGRLICPPETEAFNPAFDVTPSRLIDAIITEAGVLRPPYEQSLGKLRT
jgi:methylthioribose-1-phosphate isomerase